MQLVVGRRLAQVFGSPATAFAVAAAVGLLVGLPTAAAWRRSYEVSVAGDSGAKVVER